MPPRKKLTDPKLEAFAIGEVFLLPEILAPRAVEVVSAEDFENPLCRTIWRAVESLVAEGKNPVFRNVIERAGIEASVWSSLVDRTGVPPAGLDPMKLCGDVADLAARRRIVLLGSSLQGMAHDDRMEPAEIVESAVEHLGSVRSVVPELPPPRSLAEIIADRKPEEYRWLAPFENLFERGDVLMMTGGEGRGKMTFLRQLAVQGAAGIHPFTGDRAEPCRSLVIDLQDGEVRNERQLRRIAQRGGVDPSANLWAQSWRNGVNVVGRVSDRRRVEGLIKSTRPDLVVIGPVYKLAMGEDRVDPKVAQAILDFLDRLRARYDVALFLEAHSPMASNPGQQTYRPFGSQVFLAWPDAGYGLAPDGDHAAKLKDWRGNRDREAKIWPPRLVWGEVWPWVPSGKDGPARFGPLRGIGHSGRLVDGNGDGDPDEGFMQSALDEFDQLGTSGGRRRR